MVASLSWLGVDRFAEVLEKSVGSASRAARNIVAEGLHMAEDEMKHKAGLGGRHKKGEPTEAIQGSGPAVVSGTLRRSIRVGEIIPWGQGGWSGEVGPTAIYGRRIELEYNYPYAGPGWREVVPKLAPLAHRVWSEYASGKTIL